MIEETINSSGNHLHLLRADARGFSFVEMLIAMAILSLGLMAAASMQYGSVRNNTTGNVYTQARMLAKAQLEELKGQPLDNLVVGGPYSDGGPVDAEGLPGGIYNRTWAISDWGSGARYITVTVSWDRRGRSDSIVISSKTGGGGV